jgi:glycerol kinase
MPAGCACLRGSHPTCTPSTVRRSARRIEWTARGNAGQDGADDIGICGRQALAWTRFRHDNAIQQFRMERMTSTHSSHQPQYVLALDQGTSSSRAILFDHAGNVVRIAQREFRQYYPHPGHVEHDPYEIWQSQLAVAHEVLTDANVSGSQPSAIGITNQRETTVLWDRKTGEPGGRALVWQDRRTAPMCEDLQAAGHGDTFQQKTGLIIDAYFSGTKLRWMLDNYDGARARAERGELAFGTVDSWLIWQLTDGARHVTDVSNASRTLLFNIHDFRWDDELLGLLTFRAACCPKWCRRAASCAPRRGCSAWKMPIAGIAGDQQAATFGQACLRRAWPRTPMAPAASS